MAKSYICSWWVKDQWNRIDVAKSYICIWWVKDMGNRIDVAKSYICSWWVKDLGNRIEMAKSYICSWWVKDQGNGIHVAKSYNRRWLLRDQGNRVDVAMSHNGSQCVKYHWIRFMCQSLIMVFGEVLASATPLTGSLLFNLDTFHLFVSVKQVPFLSLWYDMTWD